MKSETKAGDDVLREVRAGSAALDDPRTRPLYEVYRRLRRIVVSVRRRRDPESIVLALLEGLVHEGDRFASGATAYRRLDGRFERFFSTGDLGLELADRLAGDHPLLVSVLEKGWMEQGGAGSGDRLAGLALGPGRAFVLFFSVDQRVAGGELETVLLSVASIADLALEQHDLVRSMEQAREIQTSLLPEAPPEFPGFELAMRSRPAVLVGGDIIDFHPKGTDTLGIVVGDASGHGLAAALHARDAVVGLRVGVEENLKVVNTLEKLDRVLRRSGKSNHFVSLFFGEIDGDGNLIYVSAGHNPALLIRARTGRAERLSSTGPVLGLPLDGHFRRAFQRLEPGDLLAIYTDGVVEAADASGEEHGIERLIATLSPSLERPVEAVVSGVFDALDGFTRTESQTDDQSLVVIRRRSSSSP